MGQGSSMEMWERDQSCLGGFPRAGQGEGRPRGPCRPSPPPQPLCPGEPMLLVVAELNK